MTEQQEAIKVLEEKYKIALQLKQYDRAKKFKIALEILKEQNK